MFMGGRKRKGGEASLAQTISFPRKPLSLSHRPECDYLMYTRAPGKMQKQALSQHNITPNAHSSIRRKKGRMDIE
jgi:hypothetical protein